MRTARRHFLFTVVALATAPLLANAAPVSPGQRMQVWKDPACGCCKEWIAQIRAAGFDVVAHETGNVAARRRARISDAYGSCHTALVGGYALEGHVPVREIRRLLRERPDAIGLAVPGMVVGSPGMEQGDRREPYSVLLLHRDGGSSTYAKYSA